MARKPTYKELEQRIRELEKKTSKRKRAREALGEFREFKEKIMSESPIGMSMYDSSGQCVAANDSVGKLIGATKEQVLEQNYNDIESWKTSGMLDKAKSAIRENSKKRYELIVKSTFGKDVSLDCHLVPFSSEGKTHLLLMINDISERIQAEEALQKAHAELERRVEERTEELLKANKQLEIEIEERERTEERYRTLVESSLTGIFIHQDGKYVFMNDKFGDIHGYQPGELLGQDPLTLIHPDQREALRKILLKRLKGEDVPTRYEVHRLKKDGETIWCEMMAARIEYAGRPAIMGNVIDITERKQAEEALLESARRLQLAYEQAIAYAKELHKKIDELKRAEEALQRKKEQLKAKAQSLEEVNTALKVLLKQREEDKIELEEKVLSNIKQLVLPYVETLKKSRLGDELMAYVSIIESNLTDIVSPFLRKLSSKYLSLTPKEIQIADLVKIGKTTKEIADLLNVSIRAIEFHRENIRAKLGLKNQPINLRTQLLSIE